MFMNAYKVLMLFIEAIVITYMVGCVWYFLVTNINTKEDIKKRLTFITKNDLDKITDLLQLVTISCYYAIATLTTIGYGDLYPVSSYERICAILIELFGMIFFANIMNSFVTIIENYNKLTGEVDRSNEITNWMILLSRFTDNQPLPKSLINQIEAHYQNFWANNRIAAVQEEGEHYMSNLPWDV